MERTALLLALAMVMTVALAGVAYAKTFVGTNQHDALPGDDAIYGGRGFDEMYGNGGDDYMNAGSGDAIISGGYGNDYLVGGRDGAGLYGNAGDDYLVVGPYRRAALRAVLWGYSGNDRIEAANGQRDLINCGPGDKDRASVDKNEVAKAKNCEFVNGKRR
jgi:Ca2+-binding RTX toxin-like protein